MRDHALSGDFQFDLIVGYYRNLLIIFFLRCQNRSGPLVSQALRRLTGRVMFHTRETTVRETTPLLGDAIVDPQRIELWSRRTVIQLRAKITVQTYYKILLHTNPTLPRRSSSAYRPASLRSGHPGPGSIIQPRASSTNPRSSCTLSDTLYIEHPASTPKPCEPC